MTEITFDLEDTQTTTNLTTRMYRNYQYDCLNTSVFILRKAIDQASQLYPETKDGEIEKVSKILEVEIIARFCQCAENLAILAMAFKRSYPSEEQEILGLNDKLVRHGLGEITDFYSNIHSREPNYIAKIIGYPSLDIQNSATRDAFTISCNNIKEKIVEIAEYYQQLRLLYNAYKHGYRISFGTNDQSGSDIIFFITDEFEQKYTEIDTKILNTIVNLSGYCRDVMEAIMTQHHHRADHEARGGGFESIEYILFLKKEEKGSDKNNLPLLYPTRGERLEREKMEGDQIFANLQNGLGVEDNGKIIAIDIDAKIIITKDYTIDKVLEDIDKSKSSGRIHIRRISSDGNTHIEIY